MRILLTNDDGILAPGLWHAAEALREIGEVTVCAPDREQSGIGGAVTLHGPIRVTPYPPKSGARAAYAVEGTPADCVIVAMESLIQGPVDLVVAGINAGANLGADCVISGTLGAALQGHLRGVPALAISVAGLNDVHFQPVSRLLPDLARLLLQASSSPRADGAEADRRPTLLNVNLPNRPQEEIAGLSVTRLSPQGYRDTVRQGDDGRRPWYWITRDQPPSAAPEGTDLWAVQQGRVSVTPMAPDLTAHDDLASLEELVQGSPWTHMRLA